MEHKEMGKGMKMPEKEEEMNSAGNEDEKALMLEAAQSLLDKIANDSKFLEEVDHIQIMIGKALPKKKKKMPEAEEEMLEEEAEMGA